MTWRFLVLVALVSAISLGCKESDKSTAQLESGLIIPLSSKPSAEPTPKDSVQDYINRGNEEFKSGDYYEMIANHTADYTKAISINPNDSKAYVGRGVAKGNLGDNQGAIADYTEAIRLNPYYADAYYYRGTMKIELVDIKGAIADFSSAIRLKPDYARAYDHRGDAKAHLGDKQGAIADFSEAIRLDPNFYPTYLSRGDAKAHLGDKQGAIADYKEFIRFVPDYAPTIHILAFDKIRKLERSHSPRS